MIFVRKFGSTTWHRANVREAVWAKCGVRLKASSLDPGSSNEIVDVPPIQFKPAAPERICKSCKRHHI